MSLQAVVLLGLTLAPPGGSSSDGDDAVAGWSPVPPEVYELSRSRNIIHIVLDMFPSHMLAEIRDADPSTFDRAWSGWAHSRFPGHALTPTGVMAIRCKQFHLPDL